MKCVLSMAFLLATTITFSQTSIELKDVSKHVGDSVKVCGKVYGIRYLEQSKNSPTFINIGGAYPNQLLTVVIWGDVRKKFEKTPEELFKDKEICVSGKIELFKGKGQVVVEAREQIIGKD